MYNRVNTESVYIFFCLGDRQETKINACIQEKRVAMVILNNNITHPNKIHQFQNRIGGVMVSVLVSSSVDRVFEPRL